MRQVVALSLFALLLAPASSAHAAYGEKYASAEVHNLLIAADETKYAFVDVQQVLALSNAGKEAKAIFDGDVLKAEMNKNAREKELNRLKAELDAQSAQLSETEKSDKQKAYELKLKEYQQFVAKSSEDLQSENVELTRNVVGKIMKVVQEYGRKRGFLGIFFKNEGMLYLDDKVDITGAILQTLNASTPDA